MRYSEPLSNQVLMFISSIGPGVLIGLIYDVFFSFFRVGSTKKAFTVISDLSFSLIATLISFFYMVIYNSGTVRLNIISAQIIGAVAFHYTLGRYISVPVSFAGNIMSKIFVLLFKPVSSAFRFIVKKLTFVESKLRIIIKNRKNKEPMSEKNNEYS